MSGCRCWTETENGRRALESICASLHKTIGPPSAEIVALSPADQKFVGAAEIAEGFYGKPASQTEASIALPAITSVVRRREADTDWPGFSDERKRSASNLAVALFKGAAVEPAGPLHALFVSLYTPPKQFHPDFETTLVNAEKRVRFSLSDCECDRFFNGLIAVHYRRLLDRQKAGENIGLTPKKAMKLDEKYFVMTAMLGEAARSGNCETSRAFFDVIVELEKMQREFAQDLAEVGRVARDLFSGRLRINAGPLANAEFASYNDAYAARAELLDRRARDQALLVSEVHRTTVPPALADTLNGTPIRRGLLEPPPHDHLVVPETAEELVELAKPAILLDVFNGCRKRAENAGRSATAAAVACASLAKLVALN